MFSYENTRCPKFNDPIWKSEETIADLIEKFYIEHSEDMFENLFELIKHISSNCCVQGVFFIE